MSYETLFQNALSLHEAGRLDEAEKIYRQILETASEQPDVLNLLGLIAQAKGLQKEAISLFSRAIAQKPQEVPFWYNLAYSYRLSAKYREGLDAFAKVLKLRPDIKEAHNEMGLLYQQLGDFDKAKQSFQFALDLDANYCSARINKAMLFRYSNVFKAIDKLEKLSSSYENEALLWFYLAQLYIETQNLPKAWQAASKTKELAPESDEARIMLGELSLFENDLAKAKIYFAKAELLNSQNIVALLRLADIFSKEEIFDEAEKRYKRVIELDRDNFEAHQNYAEMLYRAQRITEALEEYRQAIILNPQSAEVCNNLALILRDINDYGQASDLLLNAFKLKPELQEITINLSETITLWAENAPNDALIAANSWLKLAPDNIFAQKLKATLQGERFENNHLYNEKLFDRFADNYELVMQNLGYSAQVAVARIIGYEQAVIVDLGCGTGLLGEVLKPVAKKLIGVDISQNMLDKASQKHIYDELVKDEIAQFLQKRNDFDIAVMGDVCNYLNYLAQIFALLKNKKIIFTIEVADENRTDISGRYQYNPQDIELLLYENGFATIYKESLIIRKENGKDVYGIIFKAE